MWNVISLEKLETLQNCISAALILGISSIYILFQCSSWPDVVIVAVAVGALRGTKMRDGEIKSYLDTNQAHFQKQPITWQRK